MAANGDNIAIYSAGRIRLSGGTSASAPIFSAVINRLNEARLNVGKSAIGFLNPSLYANPGMLNDITNGSNPGCNTIGFSAVKGVSPLSLLPFRTSKFRGWMQSFWSFGLMIGFLLTQQL